MIDGLYLGLDLSLSCAGYAVVKVVGEKIRIIEVGHIKTNPRKKHGERLVTIYDKIDELVEKHGEFTEVAREKGFSRYAATTQALFKVVGVVDYLMSKHGINTIYEYPPTTVKKCLTGYGYADKKEVEAAVLETLNSKTLTFATDDESDALAVIITHLRNQPKTRRRRS